MCTNVRVYRYFPNKFSSIRRLKGISYAHSSHVRKKLFSRKKKRIFRKNKNDAKHKPTAHPPACPPARRINKQRKSIKQSTSKIQCVDRNFQLGIFCFLFFPFFCLIFVFYIKKKEKNMSVVLLQHTLHSCVCTSLGKDPRRFFRVSSTI